MSSPTAPVITNVISGNQSIDVYFTQEDLGGGNVVNYLYSLNGSEYATALQTSSPITISGLTNGYVYNIRLVVTTDAETQNISQPSDLCGNIIPYTTPSAPTIIDVSAGVSSILVHFTDGDNGGYSITEYKYSLDTGTTYVDISYSASPLTITDVSAGDTYTVILKAVSGAPTDAVSAESNTSASVVPFELPQAPTIDSVTAGISQATLSFTEGSHLGGTIVGYKYSIDDGETYLDASGTSSPIVIEGLTNGTQYTVLLQAVVETEGGVYTSASSAPSSAFTPYEIPQSPSIISVYAGNQSVTVYFTEGSHLGSSVLGYKYSIDAGATYVDVSGTTSPFVVEGLTNGTEYTIILKMETDAPVGSITGDSAPSTAFVPYTKPSAPTVSVDSSNNALIFYYSDGGNGGYPVSKYQYLLDLAGQGEVQMFPVSSPSSQFTIAGAQEAIRNGTYNVSASSYYGVNYPYNLLDGNSGSTWENNWNSANYRYLGSGNGAYTGISSTTVSGVGSVGGEWMQIQFPNSIIVNTYGLETYSNFLQRYPKEFYILGSTDGTTWFVIDHRTNQTISNYSMVYYNTPDKTIVTKYLRFVIVSMVTGYYATGDFNMTSLRVGAISPSTYTDLPVTDSSFVVSGLTNETTYNYKFRQVTTAPTDNVSDTIDVSGTPTGSPSPPTFSVDGSNQTLEMSYTAPALTGGYPIIAYYYNVDGGEWVEIPDTTGKYVIPALTNGTMYEIRMKCKSAHPLAEMAMSQETSPVYGVPYTCPDAPTIVDVYPNNGGLVVKYEPSAYNGGYPIAGYQYSTDGTTFMNTTQYRSNFQLANTITGTWIGGGSIPVLAVFVVNGEKVYAGEDGGAVKMATVSGIQKYFSGTVADFNVNNWDSYGTIPVAGAYVVTPIDTIQLVGSPTLDTSVSKIGTSSLLLNSTATQYATITSFAINTAGFSMAFWIRPNIDTLTSPVFLFETMGNYTTSGAMSIYMDTDGSLKMTANPDGVLSTYVIASSISSNDGQWTHIAITINKYKRLKAYINGALTLTQTTSIILGTQTHTSVYVGKTGSSSVRYNGHIDDFRVYNGKVLSINEIGLLYNYDGKPSFALNEDASMFAYNDFNTNTGMFAVQGLQNGTPASVYLRAYSSAPANIYSGTDMSMATPFGAPTAPKLDLVAGENYIDVSYGTPASNTSGYSIVKYQYSYEDGALVDIALDGQAPNISGLVLGNKYDVFLHTVSDAPYNNISTSTYKNIGTHVQPLPPTISAVDCSNTTLTVYYSNSADLGGYDLSGYQYSINSGTTWIYVASSPFTITGLTNGTTYSVIMRTITGAPDNNVSTSSTAVDAIPYTKPQTPTIYNVDSSGEGLDIYYGLTNNGGYAIDHYEIAVDGGAYISMGTQMPYELAGSFTIGGVYNIKIRAISSAPLNNVSSDSAIWKATYVGTQIPTPVVLSADISNGTMDVTYTQDSYGVATQKFICTQDETTYSEITEVVTTGSLIVNEINTDTSLCAYYTFETDSVNGTSLANKASGSYVYDATMSTSGLVSSSDKVVGKSSLQLSSPLKWVTLPQMNLGQNGFTISFWFKHQSSSSYARIFDFDNFSMPILSNSFYIAGLTWQYNGTTTINDNTWRHFAITLSSTGYLTVYINGSVAHQSQRAYPANTNFVNNYIGKSNVAGDNFPITGGIDEFRIYRRVLGSADITKLYQYTGDIDTRQNILQYDLTSPLKIDNLVNGAQYSFKIRSVLDTSASVVVSNSKFATGTTGWTVDGSSSLVNTVAIDNFRTNLGIDASNVVSVNQSSAGTTILSQPVNIYGAGKYILKVSATSGSVYDASSQTIQLGIDGVYSTSFKMTSGWRNYIHLFDIPTSVSTKQLQLKINNTSIQVAVFDPASMTADISPFTGSNTNSTGLAITDDENRVLQSNNNGRISFATRTNGVWSAWQNTLDTTTRSYRGVCVSADGSLCAVVAGDATADYCYYATWNGTNYSTFTQTLDNNARKYSGCAMTKDGTRLVASVLVGNIYFATWNGTNYSAFTQTLDTTSRRYIGIACTPDGGRIAYGPDGATGYTYYADWNGENYSSGTQTLSTTGRNSRGFAFSADAKYLYYTVQGNTTATLYYASWNGTNYSAYTASSAVPANLDAWALAINSKNDALYLAPYGTTTTYKVKIPYSVSVNQIGALGQLLANKKPWGIYSAEDYNATTGTIPEMRGLNTPAIISGTGISYLSASGNGASTSIPQLTGTTSTKITFPAGSIPSTFTICAITRYNGGTRSRVLQSTTGNWLLGHWGSGGRKRQAYFENWVTNNTTTTNLDNWQVICGKNSGSTPNNILADGVAIGTATGGSGGYTLTINNSQMGEVSNFAFSHVFIWNQALTDSEMQIVSQSLLSYLQTGTSYKQYFPSGSTLGITNVSLSKAFVSPLSNATENVIPYTSPLAPTINTLDVSNQSITISYSDATYDGGYSITKYQYTIDGGVSYIDVALGTRTFTITGLTNGATYTIAMRSVSSAPSGNYSANSATKSGIPYTRASAPTITSVDPSNASIIVHFNPADTGGYSLVRYEYSINGGAYVSATTQLVSPITISGLTNGTTYSVKIRQVTSAPLNTSSPDSNLVADIVPYTTPSAPSITSITPSYRTLSVAYTAPASGGRPITSYKYSLNGGALIDISTAQPLVISSGLANATEYTVRIYAVNLAGTSSASNAVASTPFSVPSAPQILAVIPGDRTATVQFSYSADNGGYVVQGYKYSFNGVTYTDISYSTFAPHEMVFNGLTNGTSYTLTIKSFNSKGLSPVSNSVTFTPNANPATPVINTIDPVFEGATVYYSNGIGSALITGYKYSVNGGEFVDASYTATTISVKNLVNRRLYYVKIRAYNPIFDSSDSNQIPVYAGAPLDPVIVDVSAIGTTAYIHFTQEQNDSDPIDLYEVFSSGTKLWTTDNLTSPIIVPDLVSGKSYNIQIRAINTYGASFYSNMKQNVRFGVPPAKIMKVGVSLSYSTATIRVVAVDNKNFPITQYKYSLNGGALVNAGSSPIFTIGGLIKDTSYNVCVVATNEIGNSIPSDPVYFQLTYAQVPEKPVISRIAMPDKNTLSIFINNPPPSITPILKYKYALFRNGVVDTEYTETVGASLPITIGGLLPNTTYTARIIAVNDAGDSPVSDTYNKPVSFTYYPPTAPIIVTTRNVGGQMYAVLKLGNSNGSPITDIKYSYNGGLTYTSSGKTTSPLLLVDAPLNTRIALRIKLVNSAGDSEPSKQITFTRIYTVPTPPRVRRITPGKNNAVVRVITSQPNGAPVTQYKYSINDGAFVNVTLLTGSLFTITGLTANTEYTLNIVSVNAVGTSPAGFATFTTLK